MESMKDYEKELEESYEQLDGDYIEQAETEGDDTWVNLKQQVKNREIINVKIKEAVKGGVIAFVDELRAFIPASLISDTYTEDLNEWVGKHIDVIVTEADKEKKRIILSGRDVIRDRKKAEKEEALRAVKVGDEFEGRVDSIQPYGAFIDLGGGLSGLVHISQMAERRIKSPKEVVSEGDTVKVKVTKIEDGKISLTMRGMGDEAVTEDEEGENDAPVNIESEALTTSLGSLLAGIKLDN